MKTPGRFSSVILTLILAVLFGSITSLKAQSKPSYSEAVEHYRIIAVKNDSTEVESVSNTRTLVKSTTIYFPNAFTPDRDGVNDAFGAVGINAEKYDLKIYNRWGELIFTSDNIENKWDGTYQGKVVPEGVYVYSFSARETATGKQISRSGTVTVLL